MKPFRLTAFIAVLLAALVGYLYFIDIKQEKAKEEQEKLAKDVVRAAQEDIVTVTLSTFTEGRPITLEKRSDGWVLTAPIEAPADQTIADGLAGALKEVKIEQEIDAAPKDLGAFGLQHPLLTVFYKARNGETNTILFGDINPVNSLVYFKTSDSPRVLATKSYIKENFERSLLDFRDKRVFVFNDEDVTGIEIAGGAPGTAAVALTRKDNDWLFKGPPAWDASDEEVRTLLSVMRGLRASDFPENPGVNFARPDMTVTLTVGPEGNRQIAKLVATGDAEFAQREGQPWVMALPPDSIEKLRKDPADLRERQVVDFNRYSVQTLVVQRGSGERFTLSKVDGESPEKWELTTFEGGSAGGAPKVQPASQQAVAALLSKLESLIAAEFIDIPGRYGMEGGDGVTITGKDREAKELFGVVLGAPAPGGTGGRYARNTKKPQIFVLGPESTLNTAAADYAESATAKPATSAAAASTK